MFAVIEYESSLMGPTCNFATLQIFLVPRFTVWERALCEVVVARPSAGCLQSSH